MKAVIAVVPEELLERERRTGADRWHEVWDGVLHIPPLPTIAHQELGYDLEDWLRRSWARPWKGRAYRGVGVAPGGNWLQNYRIPDLILLPRDRLAGIRGEYFEGPPLVVVEIRSPGDESYEKLPFYAALGTPEVWIVDRDSREIEVLVLNRGTYAGVEPGADGWRTSPATGMQFRPQPDRKLALRLESHPADVTMIPEEDGDPA